MTCPHCSFSPVLLLAGILTLSGCSILEPDGPEIRVVNRTESTILVWASEEETSHLVDLAPSFHVSPDDDRMLRSGASRTLESAEIIGGFEAGDHLVLFLYEVEDDTAEYRLTLVLSPADLLESAQTVRIRRLTSPDRS